MFEHGEVTVRAGEETQFTGERAKNQSMEEARGQGKPGALRQDGEEGKSKRWWWWRRRRKRRRDTRLTVS